jgi:hypothetical protein
MTRRSRIVTYVLVAMVLLSGRPSYAAGSVASQADLDRAITKTLGQEEAARNTITTLLRRDDVRNMAQGAGLDVRRAEAAVRTLQGDELQRLASLAAAADTQLAGGDQVISISLVSLLLIILIVVLLTN